MFLKILSEFLRALFAQLQAKLIFMDCEGYVFPTSCNRPRPLVQTNTASQAPSPQRAPSQDHKDFQIQAAGAALREGLAHAYRIFQGSIDVSIKYTLDPKLAVRSVTVNRKYDKGQLCLVPLTLSMGLCPSSKMPSNAVLVPSLSNCPEGHCAYVSPCMVFPGSTSANAKKDSFVVPFWAIPSASAKGAHNVSPALLKVEVASSSSTGKNAKVEIKVPIFINTGVVEKGTQVFKPHPDDLSMSSSPGKRLGDKATEGPKAKAART
jgi:hypothetical protein